MKYPSEHAEQVALFQWAGLMSRQHPELALLFAIPNGGHRHIGTARKLKAEGVKAGVPDIFLPVRSAEYAGLFIEMKTGKNKPTELQAWWHEQLKNAGYIVEVCYGWQAAREIIEEYIGGMPF